MPIFGFGIAFKYPLVINSNQIYNGLDMKYTIGTVSNGILTCVDDYGRVAWASTASATMSGTYIYKGIDTGFQHYVGEPYGTAGIIVSSWKESPDYRLNPVTNVYEKVTFEKFLIASAKPYGAGSVYSPSAIPPAYPWSNFTTSPIGASSSSNGYGNSLKSGLAANGAHPGPSTSGALYLARTTVIDSHTWYLPSISELLTLFNNYAILSRILSTPSHNGNWYGNTYWGVAVNYVTPSYAFAGYPLLEAQEIKPDYYYWSSTEVNATTAYAIKLSDPNLVVALPKSTLGIVIPFSLGTRTLYGAEFATIY